MNLPDWPGCHRASRSSCESAITSCPETSGWPSTLAGPLLGHVEGFSFEAKSTSCSVADLRRKNLAKSFLIGTSSEPSRFPSPAENALITQVETGHGFRTVATSYAKTVPDSEIAGPMSSLR